MPAELSESEKAKLIRENMSGVDVSQYSAAVMQNKAVLMLANENTDALLDIEPERIPYIAYLRAIDSRLPGGIPGTMLFVESQLSLSRSKDRKGRLEFGQAINKQSMIVPQMLPGMIYPGGISPQQEKPGILSRLLSRKKETEQQ
jgi:hypothetical protein